MAIVLAVIPAAVAAVGLVAGQIGAYYAAVRDRTKRLVKRMGLWSKKTKLQRVRQLKPGDHICYTASISSLIYHHAIIKRVIDDGTVEVIHYSGPPKDNRGSTVSSSSSSSSSASITPSSGSVNKKTSVMVRKDKENLSQVASKGNLYRVDYEKDDKCYPPDVVIQRAESKIGEPGLRKRKYHLFRNNCEHFATWCKTGEAFSQQSGLIQN